MRKALIAVGVVAAIAVAGLVALLLVDVNQFRPQIESQLEKRLSRSVSLGTLGLKLLPLAIRIENVNVGEQADFRSSRPFLTAKQIDLRVALMPLLRRQLTVESLAIHEPKIELIRNAKGVWNYSTLSSGSSGGESGGQFALGALQIVNGSIGVTQAGIRSGYESIDADVRGLGSDKLDVALDVHLPGSAGQVLSLKGSSPGSSTFDGRLTLKDATVEGLGRALGSSALAGAAGVMNGEAAIKLQQKILSLDGNLTLRDARFGGVSFSDPLRLDYRVTNDLNRDALQIPALTLTSKDLEMKAVLSASPSLSGSGTIRNATLPLTTLRQPLKIANAAFRLDGNTLTLEGLQCSLGSSTLKGGLTVRNFSKPNLQFTAAIDQIDTAELQQLSTGKSDSSSKGSSSPLVDITGSGMLTVGSIRQGELNLSQVKAACSLDRGVIRLAPVESQAAGGQVTGEITIDTRPQYPAIAVNTKLARVDANQLLSAVSKLKGGLSGVLAGDADTRFVMQPGEDIARSLNGTVRVQLSDGKLLGANLLNEMSAIGKFAALAKRAEPFTAIKSLAATMTIKDGVASTEDMRLELDGAHVGGAGTINLNDQSVNLRLTTTLSREFADRAGGKSIGGLMSTVLANPQGEMIIPAMVSGPFTKPRFALDAERFAKMKLQSVLPSGAQGARQQLDSVIDLFRRKKDAKK